MRFILPVILLLTVFLPAFSQVDLQSGLVACYALNGNADDGSGHGYHGTVQGATPTTDRNGVPNTAYDFNGFGNYIAIPAQYFKNANYSYSVWAKGEATLNDGESGNIISIGDAGDSRHQTVNFSNSYSTAGFVGINIGGYNNGTPPTTSVQSGILPTVNRWYHIVSVRTNTEMTMYVDGVKIGSTSTQSNTPYYGTNVSANFGARCNLSQYFNGTIDDVVIYNRAINADEVLELYEHGLPCDQPLSVKQCGPGAFVLAAPGGFHYRWYDAPVGGHLLFEGNPFTTPILHETTRYYITRVVNGSESSPRALVVARPLPLPALTCNFPDSVYTEDDNPYAVVTTSGTPPYTYTFDFGDQTVVTTTSADTIHQHLNAGTYLVKARVEDAEGCTAACDNIVQVEVENIFIPNIITPGNNDPFNPVFTLYLNVQNEYILYYGTKKFLLRIFNRWEKEIFRTENSIRGWDGRGETAGVYYYLINFGKKRFKGWVHLVK